MCKESFNKLKINFHRSSCFLWNINQVFFQHYFPNWFMCFTRESLGTNIYQDWILTLKLFPGHAVFWRGTFSYCCRTQILYSQVSCVDQNTLIFWLPLVSAWIVPFQVKATPILFPVHKITSSLTANRCPAVGSGTTWLLRKQRHCLLEDQFA